MKNLLIILTLLFTTHSFALEIDEHGKYIREATMTHYFMGHDQFASVSHGVIQINDETNTIRLVLFDYSSPSCPDDTICGKGTPKPTIYEIELPIIEVKTEYCGGTIYLAEKDMTSVDGLKEQISVVDNSTLICRIKPAAQTVISYESFNPWTQETQVSNMYARQLLSQKQ